MPDQQPPLNEPVTGPRPGARSALVLLLLINLFNYIDRQVLASVVAPIQKDLLPNDPHADQKAGWLATAFILSYMLTSPVFGWLADRISRWLLVGIGVILWSLASGASGLAGTFMLLLITRLFVGVGEGAYGPAAPTMISDLYPVRTRGKVLAWFYVAIPVGSALGYVLGGGVAAMLSWHWAFFLVVPPGLLLGIWCFFMPEPPRGLADLGTESRKATMADYLLLLRNKSYVLNTLAMTAMTFAIQGIGFWMPKYIAEFRRHGTLASANLLFGAIVVVAGLAATLLGGIAGDKLRDRFPGSYFLVSAAGMIGGFALFIVLIFTPFPMAWIVIALAVFCLFFNTGPSNTALANVTHPSMRATAFALNILVIHALGDAISPPIVGAINDHFRSGPGNVPNMNIGFAAVSGMMLLGGLIWLWASRYLAADTAAAPTALRPELPRA